MNERFKITLAQLNPTVGDLAGNSEKARSAWAAGKAAKSDFVGMPEMFMSGYQAQDLVMKPAFVADVQAHIATLAKECADGPALGIVCPQRLPLLSW